MGSATRVFRRSLTKLEGVCFDVSVGMAIKKTLFLGSRIRKTIRIIYYELAYFAFHVHLCGKNSSTLYK